MNQLNLVNQESYQEDFLVCDPQNNRLTRLAELDFFHKLTHKIRHVCHLNFQSNRDIATSLLQSVLDILCLSFTGKVCLLVEPCYMKSSKQ